MHAGRHGDRAVAAVEVDTLPSGHPGEAGLGGSDGGHLGEVPVVAEQLEHLADGRVDQPLGLAGRLEGVVQGAEEQVRDRHRAPRALLEPGQLAVGTEAAGRCVEGLHLAAGQVDGGGQGVRPGHADGAGGAEADEALAHDAPAHDAPEVVCELLDEDVGAELEELELDPEEVEPDEADPEVVLVLVGVVVVVVAEDEDGVVVAAPDVVLVVDVAVDPLVVVEAAWAVSAAAKAMTPVAATPREATHAVVALTRRCARSRRDRGSPWGLWGRGGVLMGTLWTRSLGPPWGWAVAPL